MALPQAAIRLPGLTLRWGVPGANQCHRPVSRDSPQYPSPCRTAISERDAIIGVLAILAVLGVWMLALRPPVWLAVVVGLVDQRAVATAAVALHRV
jgi:hypothetical protein